MTGGLPGIGRRHAGRASLTSLAAILLAACATTALLPPDGPLTNTISIAGRGWHTDVCLRTEDANAWIAILSQGFDGARFLCFGFGERQYFFAQNHNVLTMAAALLPSHAVLLMTVLRDTPTAAFGPANVVNLGVSREGMAGLEAFLRHSTETDATGQPRRLGDGPYPGSVFFAATGTYDAFYTCNTWTADALRSARLPIGGAVLFSGDLMREVRQAAAAQLATAQLGGT